MDKRTYLTKSVEPNEIFFQLLIDICMYSKYKLINDDDPAMDTGIIDLLKKTKTCLIRILVQPEFKSLIAELSMTELSKSLELP